MRRWYHWIVWVFRAKPDHVSEAWLKQHCYSTGTNEAHG